MPLSLLSRLLNRMLGLSFGCLVLTACAGGFADHYPMKGDSDPHKGVARAHAMEVHGIDVSRWQGDIDWRAVAAAGTRFAYIKATEGGDHLDPMFWKNWREAQAAGVPRGAYHFVYWCRPAHEQLEWFRLNVPADPTALPPVLDVEWNGHSRNCPQQTSPDEAYRMIRVMLAGMEAHTGKKPIIYTDIPFHRDVLEGRLNEYPFWVRSVAAEPHERYANRNWLLWQFTTTGRVPGIKGHVDRNAFNGNLENWNTVLASWMQQVPPPGGTYWAGGTDAPTTAGGYEVPAYTGSIGGASNE